MMPVSGLIIPCRCRRDGRSVIGKQRFHDRTVWPREAARESYIHPREEHDGLDSPEYVDTFFDDTSGRALDPVGVKTLRLTGIQLIQNVGVGNRISIESETWSQQK